MRARPVGPSAAIRLDLPARRAPLASRRLRQIFGAAIAHGGGRDLMRAKGLDPFPIRLISRRSRPRGRGRELLPRARSSFPPSSRLPLLIQSHSLLPALFLFIDLRPLLPSSRPRRQGASFPPGPSRRSFPLITPRARCTGTGIDAELDLDPDPRSSKDIFKRRTIFRARAIGRILRHETGNTWR